MRMSSYTIRVDNSKASAGISSVKPKHSTIEIAKRKVKNKGTYFLSYL